MMSASVNLSKGPLENFSRGLAEAQSAYVKVGVLGAYASRSKGQTQSKRWRSIAKWSKGLKLRDASGKTVSIGAGHLTNAQIGAIHEFGSPGDKIPERSFLRMPILSKLGDELKTIPGSDWKNVFADGAEESQSGGLIAVLRVVGQAAVNVVQDAFNTGGFGRWAKLSKATIARKGSSEILIETTQLRRSITFAVVAPGSTGKPIK